MTRSARIPTGPTARPRGRILAGATLAVGGLLLAGCATDLGAVDGAGTTPTNINDDGWVVGAVADGTPTQKALAHSPAPGSGKALATPADATSMAVGSIPTTDGDADIIGTTSRGGRRQGTIWSYKSGEVTRTVRADTYTDVSLVAIAPDRTLVGTITRPVNFQTEMHAAYWESDGTVHVLDTVPGRPGNSSARDINAGHTVIGQVGLGQGQIEAGPPGVIPTAESFLGTGFVWNATGGIWAPLGFGDQPTQLRAINNIGTIVGSAFDADGTSRAATWSDQSVDMGVVPTPAGATSSTLVDVNDRGMAIGHASTPDGIVSFCVSLSSGTVTVLGGDLIVTAINNRGVLAGRPTTGPAATAHTYSADTCKN